MFIETSITPHDPRSANAIITEPFYPTTATLYLNIISFTADDMRYLEIICTERETISLNFNLYPDLLSLLRFLLVFLLSK